MPRSGLHIVSANRHERLTNAETVRLGRRLHELLGVDHVSYPDDAPTVVVDIWDYAGALSPDAATSIEEVIGALDLSSVEE